MADASGREKQVRAAFRRLTDFLADQPERLNKVSDSQRAFEEYVFAQISIFDSENDGTTAPLKRNKTSEVLWGQRLQIIEGLVRDIRPDEGLA